MATEVGDVVGGTVEERADTGEANRKNKADTKHRTIADKFAPSFTISTFIRTPPSPTWGAS